MLLIAPVFHKAVVEPIERKSSIATKSFRYFFAAFCKIVLTRFSSRQILEQLCLWVGEVCRLTSSLLNKKKVIADLTKRKSDSQAETKKGISRAQRRSLTLNASTLVGSNTELTSVIDSKRFFKVFHQL